MILKKTNPRQAILDSFERPILYKNIVILKGAVVMKFV